MYALTLIPAGTKIDFIGQRWVTYLVSGVITVASLALLFINGLAFGVDFTGGTVVELRFAQAPDLPALRAALPAGAQVQAFGGPEDLLIRLPAGQGVEALRAVVDGASPGAEWRRTEVVGPQVGGELIRKGAYAVVFTLLGILAYIWVRFEWQFGLATLAATAHDVVAMLGLFALTGWEFSLASVAAILLVAGYSVNDTVVVFDRIREEMRRYRKMPLPELSNIAVNQTLSRTIMTSLTTILALAALWAFGGPVIAGFVNALLFGVAVGTYSSVFVAAPVLLLLLPARAQEQ
ncbi:MAG TPA: protein translocase subunit SecF [Rhodospirillaceae bacterium]|jgi:preprotein translocase SecF subunit|nr:protein translocase subunit SecF [Alphaproteobacteria bacterium]HBH26644.1 protein translocase subunit SecF [Rhodospirillaceae bacterium]